MPALFDLRATSSLRDLATLLGFKPKSLAYLLYKKPSAAKYVSFAIPKRSGGVRAIFAPDADLKLLQQRLSALLLDCLDEIRGDLPKTKVLSHGFERNRSIISNASRHRKRRYVLNIDLEDFFPSINFGRVRGLFIKDKRFNLNPNVATVIAQIACHQGALPQGSPSSPVISNLVAAILDRRLAHLAATHGCRYTRYADDITFSTNLTTFPRELAVESASGEWVVAPKLNRVIQHSGFSVNAPKTRMQFKRSRQVVTGLVTNKHISVPTERRKNVRAMVNRLLKVGDFYMPMGGILSSSAPTTSALAGTLAQLNGALGHIGAVEYYRRYQTAKVALNSAHNVNTSNDNLYRRFLMYTEFYACTLPVIICEGKTDNIYLTAAIRNLSASFPSLISNNALSIRFFKYDRVNTARRLGLAGGAGFLPKFISEYAKELLRISAPGMTNPVVIVVDNDGAAKPVLEAAKQASKNYQLNLQSPYLRIVGNLYLMAIPPITGNASTVIEDLFSAPLRGTMVGGKSLHVGKNFNPAIHYGKQVFAEQVVKPNAATIDCRGFAPLLTNLSNLIVAHV